MIKQGASLHDFRKVIIRILLVWFFLDFFMSWRFGWRLTITSEMYEVKGYRDFASVAEANYAKFFLPKIKKNETITKEDRAKAFVDLVKDFSKIQNINYKLIGGNVENDTYGIVPPANTIEKHLLEAIKARNFSEFPYYERVNSQGKLLLRGLLPICLLGENSLLKDSGIQNCILMELTTPVISSMKRDPKYSVAYLGTISLMLILQGLFIEFYLSRVGATYSELKNINKALDRKVLDRTAELEEASRELSEVMGKLDATEKQRIAQEKMASIGLLASGIAHEIGNPLNFINNFADINREILNDLRMSVQDSEISEDERKALFNIIDSIDHAMQQIITHGKGTQTVVQQLQLHSAEIVSQKEKHFLNEFVNQHFDLAVQSLSVNRTGFMPTITKHFDDNVKEVDFNTEQLGRLIINIVDNAVYAIEEKQKMHNEKYRPELKLETRLDKDHVIIILEDNGIGIKPEDMKEIFKPFFTTKPTGQGAGLSIAAARDSIVKEHGGEMWVESTYGKFARFLIRLPIIAFDS